MASVNAMDQAKKKDPLPGATADTQAGSANAPQRDRTGIVAKLKAQAKKLRPSSASSPLREQRRQKQQKQYAEDKDYFSATVQDLRNELEERRSLIQGEISSKTMRDIADFLIVMTDELTYMRYHTDHRLHSFIHHDGGPRDQQIGLLIDAALEAADLYDKSDQEKTVSRPRLWNALTKVIALLHSLDPGAQASAQGRTDT